MTLLLCRLIRPTCVAAAYIVACLFAAHPTSAATAASNHAVETRAPHGPFRVIGNQLIDARGVPFLIRGTQTAPFHIRTANYDARSKTDFGPHSATSFSAIRLRFNMNAVRIAAEVTEADQPGYFRELSKLVRLANENDLLVILAADESGATMPSQKVLDFWKRSAVVFHNYPNVIFDAFSNPRPDGFPLTDVHLAEGWNLWRRGGILRNGSTVHGMQDVVDVIRGTGAQQPIALMSWNDGDLFRGFDIDSPATGGNLIYEVSPRYQYTRTDAARDVQFGFLARRAPVIANDWDLHLEDLNSCLQIPSDPVEASQLVLDNLKYFDDRGISWTASSYERGRLISETFNLTPTQLESGFTCGDSEEHRAGTGAGRLILSHQFGTEEGKFVVVNINGGLALPRGGYSIAYGRVMAEHDSQSDFRKPLYHLGGVSLKIIDSANNARPAQLYWAAAGWGSLNFIVPAESALGPAHFVLTRDDGSSDQADIWITATSPAFYTQLNCQGPARGTFTVATRDGRTLRFANISTCKSVYECSSVSIPVGSGTITTMRLAANGFRNAKSIAQIEITIGGVRVPVRSLARSETPGNDDVVVEIPPSLRGKGETDLICHVNGRLSNVVRVSIGGSKNVS